MFFKHFYSTDHKIIGLPYGFTRLFFLRGVYTIQSQAEYEAWLASEAELIATQ